MPPAPIATRGEPDAGPSSSSLEHPSTDPGKLRALPVGPGAHCGDPASGSPGSQASAGDVGSVSEPSSGTKIDPHFLNAQLDLKVRELTNNVCQVHGVCDRYLYKNSLSRYIYHIDKKASTVAEKLQES